MLINIMNYRNKTAEVEIDELKDIENFEVYVVSGDEVFSIENKFGEAYGFDAAIETEDFRILNLNSGSYHLIKDGIVSDNFDKFLKRKDAYEIFNMIKDQLKN